MDTKPILSICIPTYNRVVYLREVVESVLHQVNESNRTKVEIVISDNASDDGTKEYVQGLQASGLVIIRYQRSELNLEFDQNCLRVVALARGEYCWFLADDDQLNASAIDRMISEIENNPEVDLFLCGHEEYTINMSNKVGFIPGLDIDRNETFDFKKQNPLTYIKKVRNLAGLFGFLSALVFRKEKWLEVPSKEKFIGTAYIHVYAAMAALWRHEKGVLRYLTGPLVKMRRGSSRYPDIFIRAMLELEYYHLFAKEAIAEHDVRAAIDDIVLKSGGFTWVVNTRIGGGGGFYRKVVPVLIKYYWRRPIFWLKVVPVFFIPRFMLKVARMFYRTVIKPFLIGQYLGNINEKSLKICTVILNWNQEKDTTECLTSLRKCARKDNEIILVDNGSSDSSYEKLKLSFPEVRFIRNEKNMGFAEGNNKGIEDALGKDANYILLLNNDTMVEPDFINKMIAIFEKDESIGIVSPKIMFYHAQNRIWFVGGACYPLLGKPYHIHYNKVDNGRFDKIEDTDWVSGCCMLVKQEVFKKVGLLDKDYFNNYEDVDFCVRAKRAGYNIVVVPQAKIYHKFAASVGGKSSPFYAYFRTRNNLLFFKKTRQPLALLLNLFTFPPYALLEAVKNRSFKNVKAVYLAVRDFLVGNYGAGSAGALL